MTKKTAKTTEPAAAIMIPALNKKALKIRLRGVSPLICHAWSQKAIRMIQDAQGGKAKAGKKPPKDPHQQYCESMYWLDKSGLLIEPGRKPESHKHGFGIPCSAFKKSAIAACRNIDGMTMTLAAGAFQVIGDFALIKGSKPEMRTDTVRIARKTTDLRYRGMFKQWETTITVVYNAGVLTAEQVVNLFNVAGFACGVLEWRPNSSAGGSFGMFEVA